MSYEYSAIDDCGREVKLRKEKRCIWCGEVIKKGERAVVRVYKWEGYLNNERMHPECYPAMGEYCSDIDGEFIPYEHVRGVAFVEGE